MGKTYYCVKLALLATFFKKLHPKEIVQNQQFELITSIVQKDKVQTQFLLSLKFHTQIQVRLTELDLTWTCEYL